MNEEIKSNATQGEAVDPASALFAIGERLRTQDNRCTADPMFCVQVKVRDVGFDSAYAEQYCWHDGANDETIYDDDKNFKEPEGDEWDKFGYRDRWETVMVAFTEAGCEEYIRQNGHNHRGEKRIYAESFRRCPEMLAIREFLMANDKDHATDGARERINQQSPSDMSEVIQIPKDGSQAPSARVHPLVLRRWYFSVEDFDDNLEYLGPEGESIDEDEAKRHPFVGDTRAAEDEGERRANRWEERNNACAANVTRHSMGKTQNA